MSALTEIAERPTRCECRICGEELIRRYVVAASGVATCEECKREVKRELDRRRYRAIASTPSRREERNRRARERYAANPEPKRAAVRAYEAWLRGA